MSARGEPRIASSSRPRRGSTSACWICAARSAAASAGSAPRSRRRRCCSRRRPRRELSADGPDADRALGVRRAVPRITMGCARGARLTVHRAIPAHSGLGSGTQLGLAVARALAELHGLPPDPPALARAVDRGRRSAIGTWTFALGGFIVEGGRRAGGGGDRPAAGPLRRSPSSWRCVVAVPDGAPGTERRGRGGGLRAAPAAARARGRAGRPPGADAAAARAGRGATCRASGPR